MTLNHILLLFPSSSIFFFFDLEGGILYTAAQNGRSCFYARPLNDGKQIKIC